MPPVRSGYGAAKGGVGGVCWLIRFVQLSAPSLARQAGVLARRHGGPRLTHSLGRAIATSLRASCGLRRMVHSSLRFGSVDGVGVPRGQRARPGPEEKYEVGFGVYFAETAEEAAAMDAGTTAN